MKAEKLVAITMEYIPFFLLLGIALDTTSTLFLLQHGGVELNPFITNVGGVIGIENAVIFLHLLAALGISPFMLKACKTAHVNANNIVIEASDKKFAFKLATLTWLVSAIAYAPFFWNLAMVGGIL